MFLRGVWEAGKNNFSRLSFPMVHKGRGNWISLTSVKKLSLLCFPAGWSRTEALTSPEPLRNQEVLQAPADSLRPQERNCRGWPWISCSGEILFEHASPPSSSSIPSAITQMSLAPTGRSYEWKWNQGRGCSTPFLLCCCLIRWCWLILCIASQWKEPSRSVGMGLKELKAMNYFLLQRAFHLYKLLPPSVPFWDIISPQSVSVASSVASAKNSRQKQKNYKKKSWMCSPEIFSTLKQPQWEVIFRTGLLTCH